jgi:hypothetical protein
MGALPPQDRSSRRAPLADVALPVGAGAVPPGSIRPTARGGRRRSSFLAGGRPRGGARADDQLLGRSALRRAAGWNPVDRWERTAR